MLEISFFAFLFVRFLEVLIFLKIFFSLLKQPIRSKIIKTCITILPLTILYIYIGPVSYFILFIILFIINRNQKKKDLILTMLLSWLTLYLQGLIYSNLYLLVLINQNFIKKELNFILIYSFLMLFITIPIFWVIQSLYKKLSLIIATYSENNHINYLISFTIFSLFLSTIYIQFNKNNTSKSILIITTISLIFLSIVLLISYYILKKIKKDFTTQKEKREIDQLISYTNKLEQTQQQLRKFKHDYFNILLSLQSAIDTENITTIKNEFSKVNQYSKHTLNQYPSHLNNLSNIKVLAIKSIFLSKFLYWEEQTTEKITIECHTPIHHFYIDDIIMVRILGNLLDNAYEEISQQEHQNKFIEIAIIEEIDNIEIIIQNSICSTPKHFQILSSPHYTTKEKHSGLGLTTVQQLINEKDNIHLFSSINLEKHIFSISLLIEKI